MLEKRDLQLAASACEARKKAYAPYSHFTVGAALLCANGDVFCGTNVENASYGATLCAERNAFAHAVTQGHRSFKAIAIAGAKEKELAMGCAPCGICRQVMAEFCQKDFKIILVNEKDLSLSSVKTLDELFPSSFDLHSL